MSIIDHIMDVIKIRLTIVSFDSEINRLIPGKKVFLGSYPPRDKPLAILVLPDHRILSLPVLKKLEMLVKEGASVLGPKPHIAPGISECLNG